MRLRFADGAAVGLETMEWSDEGIVLGHRGLGESSVVAEVFTRDHGRSAGLVRGGRSRQMRPVLQSGNHVDVRWTARLSEQLGSMRLELNRGFAGEAMTVAARLNAVSSLCALLRTLPERDPHPSLYEVSLFFLGFLDDDTIWPALMVRWELAFLEAHGFGLDLSTCAATGGNDHLVYVSPKSGRAVSAAAGEAYSDRLLRLPQFLVGGRNAVVGVNDIKDGLELTAYFIEKHIFSCERSRFAGCPASVGADGSIMTVGWISPVSFLCAAHIRNSFVCHQFATTMLVCVSNCRGRRDCKPAKPHELPPLTVGWQCVLRQLNNQSCVVPIFWNIR